MTRKAELQRQLDDARALIDDARALIEALEADVAQHDRRVGALLESGEMQRTRIDALNTELAKLRNDLAAADVRNGQLNAELTSANAMLETAAAEVLRHVETVDRVLAERDEARRMVEQATREANQRRTDASEALDDAMRQIADLREEQNLLNQAYAADFARLVAMRKDRDWLEARYENRPLRNPRGHFVKRPDPRPV